MNIKLISDEQINKLYPNHYNFYILEEYNSEFNKSFVKYYSYYRFFLENILKQKLKLDEINNKIKEINLGVSSKNIYKEISYLNLDYVFIRNNVFLDRFSNTEIDEFKKACDENNIEIIKTIVNNTYQKLIMFDNNVSPDNVVNYDQLYGNLITINKALVIGVLSNNSIELSMYLKEKEREFASILGIPVTIFVYEGDYDNNAEIEFLENLNLQNEQKQKELIEKYSKYLPLGSVVVLKNGWKKLMITGYSAINMDTKNNVYDYIACLYPEGVIQSDYNILFNYEDIKSIFAIGLIDDEQKSFVNKLPDLIGDKEKILNNIQN